MGETANKVIGEPDAEGDGTVIGEFGSMETAVNDVTTAIGGSDSENGSSGGNAKGEGDSDNLIALLLILANRLRKFLGNLAAMVLRVDLDSLKMSLQKLMNKYTEFLMDLLLLMGRPLNAQSKLKLKVMDFQYMPLELLLEQWI